MTADLRRSDAPAYQPGQKVWLSTRDIRLSLPCRKLSPRFIGPFTITEQINPVTFKLHLPPEYRIQFPCLTPQTLPSFCFSFHRAWRSQSPLPLLLDDGAAYKVHEILDSRWRGGQLEYLVDWEGYCTEGRSCVPHNNILGPNLLVTFHSNHPERPAPRGRGRPPHCRGPRPSGAGRGEGGAVTDPPAIASISKSPSCACVSTYSSVLCSPPTDPNITTTSSTITSLCTTCSSACASINR
uniref:Chromo domain-containing protein n=1 Tax=Cyprinus carpio carpio TaxID=630221 RepID=A0A9J8BNF7_CYPCA